MPGTTNAFLRKRGNAAKPEPDKIYNTVKPECRVCSFAQHGFICWSDDGDCMKTMLDKGKKS